MRHLDLRRTWEVSRRNRMLSALLTLALAATASTARAQTTPRTPPQSSKGTIRGVVTVLGHQAEASPLEGIRVELTEGSQDSQPITTLTDSAGRYEFTQLPPGLYSLRVSQQGFKPYAATTAIPQPTRDGMRIWLVWCSFGPLLGTKEICGRFAELFEREKGSEASCEETAAGGPRCGPGDEQRCPMRSAEQVRVTDWRE